MENVNKLIQAQFDKMCATGKLFRSSITGQQVWETYIKSFLPADNPEVKAHNQKILTLIAEKKDDSLKTMSVEELEKLLK